jgi:hypothetical protein
MNIQITQGKKDGRSDRENNKCANRQVTEGEAEISR